MSRYRSSTTSTSRHSYARRVRSRIQTVLPSPDHPPGRSPGAPCSGAAPIRVSSPESRRSPNKPIQGKRRTAGGGTVGAGARHPASAFRAARTRESSRPPRTLFPSMEASDPELASHAASTRQTPSLAVSRAMRRFQDIAKCPLENAGTGPGIALEAGDIRVSHSWLAQCTRTRTLPLEPTNAGS